MILVHITLGNEKWNKITHREKARNISDISRKKLHLDDAWENPTHTTTTTTGKKNGSSATYHRLTGLTAADASIVNTAGAARVQIPAEIQDAPEEQRKKENKEVLSFHHQCFSSGFSYPWSLWLRAALDPVTPGTMLAVMKRTQCSLKPDCWLSKQRENTALVPVRKRRV